MGPMPPSPSRRTLTGPEAPRGWWGRLPAVPYHLGLGDPGVRVRLDVHNVKVTTLISNVFGCLQGRLEPGGRGLGLEVVGFGGNMGGA